MPVNDAVGSRWQGDESPSRAVGPASTRGTCSCPEPLGPRFAAAALAQVLDGRTAPVKAVLLDQRRIAGVGNIYADEALWRARIHPRRAGGSARSATEVRRLHRAIRAVLRRGIELQGSTLRDYSLPDGEGGGMQAEFRVYGRGGRAVRSMLARRSSGDVVAGRGTWSCPTCQPRR